MYCLLIYLNPSYQNITSMQTGTLLCKLLYPQSPKQYWLKKESQLFFLVIYYLYRLYTKVLIILLTEFSVLYIAFLSLTVLLVWCKSNCSIALLNFAI